MGLIALLKYAVNNTIGTDYFKPLDELLSATLVLRGVVGTTFTISSRERYYEDFTIVLTEDSEVYKGLERIHIVSVSLGTYDVSISYGGKTSTTTVMVDQLGKRYTVEYLFEIQKITSSGKFTVPNDVDKLYISAAGGGGGGSSGGKSTSTNSGGGGGGGADFVYKYPANVTPGSVIACTIGTGGAGGAGSSGSPKSGGAGGATVVGDILTLSGGAGGSGRTGGAATGAGARGGDGAGAEAKAGNAGSDSSVATGGAGGAANDNRASGGGGGASLGNGGAGGTYSVSSGLGNTGTYGGGGGGSSAQNLSSPPSGGAGGAGIIIFYRGVML